MTKYFIIDVFRFSLHKREGATTYFYNEIHREWIAYGKFFSEYSVLGEEISEDEMNTRLMMMELTK